MTTMTRTPLRIDDATPDAASGAGLPRGDLVVVLLVGALMALGAAMVYSASATVHGGSLELARWWTTPLRQVVFAVAGFAAMLFFAHLPYTLVRWERPGDGWWSGALLLVSAGLLAAMLIPGVGVTRLGAQRSIELMTSPLPLSFQPAELAKVILPIWTAALLARPGCDPRSLTRGFLPAVLTGGALIGLTAIEDYGTAALMGVILMITLYLAGARMSHLFGAAALGGAAGAAFLLMKPYRVQRLMTFLAEDPDPSREGYQVLQSLIAIGSGGWLGRGLGGGVQKYGYLPQDNNDFIFAVVCEELGVVGGMAVVAIFLLLLLRGWAIARNAPDRFGGLLACGLVLTICLQAAFNVAVVTNCVPTKGISLPFVSAGGSGVVFLGMAAGILANIGGAVRQHSHSLR